MDLFAGFARNVLHPLWLLKNHKWPVATYLQEFEKTQFDSAEVIKQRQWRRLESLLRHAYTNCVFYRRRMDEAGLTPARIKDFSDFTKLPLLTKKDIQQHVTELTASNIPEAELVANFTGGSTGSPLKFFHNRDRMFSMEAAAIRHNRWAGHDIGEKLAVVWGSQRDLPNNPPLKDRVRNFLLDRTIALDTSVLSDSDMSDFVVALRSFRPKTIQAYANAIYTFAQYCVKHNVTDIHPDAIITSAEVLHDHERELVEKVFGCKIFNRYGCREVAVISSECDRHTGMHINSDTLLIEFVDENGRAVAPGEQGNIIITDLLNYGMPFLRYKIEDVGSPSDVNCSCGRGLPLMQMVGGRSTDFIITADGRRISGVVVAVYLITNVPGLQQTQLVQESAGHVTFRIVRGPDFSDKSLAILKQKVPDYFGADMRYDVVYADNIPKEASGKFRFSISKVKPI